MTRTNDKLAAILSPDQFACGRHVRRRTVGLLRLHHQLAYPESKRFGNCREILRRDQSSAHRGPANGYRCLRVDK